MAPTVYLEAADKTQELFTLKWRLRAAGIGVGSTWHDDAPGLPHSHLNPFRAEQMRRCEVLVVLSGQNDDLRPELGTLIGLALAWGRKIVWVGTPVPSLATFDTIRWVDSIDQVPDELARSAQPVSLAA